MKLATIEQIVDIKPHPDSEVERLEIAQVLGYTCAVAKGQYQPGEKCILIQPDSVLPDCEWAEFYKKFSRTRVKAQKIRGFYSFGIVEKVSLLNDEFDIGTDASELLGIIKYEPPITDEGGKQAG
jgi:RNA ligase (TIGR02306 family)